MIVKSIGVVFILVAIIGLFTTLLFLVFYQEVIPEAVSLVFIPGLAGVALWNIGKKSERSKLADDSLEEE